MTRISGWWEVRHLHGPNYVLEVCVTVADSTRAALLFDLKQLSDFSAG